MEPWDGPAAITFTDGRVIGATLDRNGLRPARYVVTHDDLVVLASETGVLPVKPEDVKMKGRLQPGKMFLVDLEQGRIVSDNEIKDQLAGRQPYGEWLKEYQITLDKLPEPARVHGSDHATIIARQRAFGYTDEDVRFLMTPMAVNGEEPLGSMGIDTPLACLSDKPQPLFNYFKQLFAQVTNPPIDPIREEMVMSLVSYIGTRAQHSGRDAAALPHAEAAASDPDQPRSGKAAPRLAGRFPRHHAARRCFPSPMARRVWSARSTASAAAPRSPSSPATRF